MPDEIRSAILTLTSTVMASALKYSDAIAEVEVALAAGATAKQVEATATRCTTAMQVLAELLNALAISLPISSIRNGREL